MTHSNPSEPLLTSRNAWEQRLPVWHIAFGSLLLAATALALAPPNGTPAAQLVIPVALLIGWYVTGLVLVPEHRDVPPVIVLAYLAIGWLIWFALADITDTYMLLLFGLFPHNFLYLRLPWSAVGAILLNLLVVLRLSEQGDALTMTWIVIMGAATVAGIALAYFITLVINQSESRKALIHALEATRSDLATAERQAGTLAERQRLAREIHDTLTQGFISIVTHLEAAESAASNDNKSTMQHHITQAKDAVRDNLAEARRFVWALRSTALDGDSLETGLREVVTRWAVSTGITARFITTGDALALDADRETTLIRVTQEALANVARHAAAHTVTVTLSYMGDVVVLDVQDDGRGFDPSAVGAGSFGLRGMRERVAGVGGAFSVETERGGGTTVVVELPLTTAREPSA